MCIGDKVWLLQGRARLSADRYFDLMTALDNLLLLLTIRILLLSIACHYRSARVRIARYKP